MPIKVFSIVGARPQFVKLAVLCRAFDRVGSRAQHKIIHTGQHYDVKMSDVFFSELKIPAPDFHLGIGSGGHGAQTGAMLHKIEEVLLAERPDWVLVYGDTNSTLAGALAASKLHIPAAHVEAGLRSFNRRMPEEINRVVADHVSTLLFSPTQLGMDNLRQEGLESRAMWTGDVMYDAVLWARQAASGLDGSNLPVYEARQYALATVHRAENTDDPERLRGIIAALDRVAAEICPVYLPIHPRTRKAIEALGLKSENVHFGEPLSYLEMLRMEAGARLILTDSGGVQKEAYLLGIPCVTLRDETEWTETLENRCNVLTGASPEAIFEAVSRISEAGPWTLPFGKGDAGDIIVDGLLNHPL